MARPTAPEGIVDALLIGIDLGTTAIKAAAFDTAGRRVGLASRPCPHVEPAKGRVELNPDELLGRAFECVCGALGDAAPARVAALAVTNQRATVLCTDAAGVPIGRAISWQDQRGAPMIAELRSRIDDDAYFRITGLPHNPVFSLAKLMWLRAQDRDRYDRADRIVLLHDWLLRRLGCDAFYCDESNASLTGMLDVAGRTWSAAVLDAAGIDAGKLARLVPSGEPVGELSAEAAGATGILAGTPLVAGGGDQQCAGVGAGATRPGVLEITLGTAAAPLCCTGSPVLDPQRRVTCCVHAAPGCWELEGLQNAAGACLAWLGRLLGCENGRLPDALFEAAGRLEPGARGVGFIPYLAGSAAPRWMPDATGAFHGLTLSHGPADLLRATMEGVSMETREVLDAIASLGAAIEEVRLTGGCTNIRAWNRIQADLFARPVHTLAEPEATLLGAAILAGCGAGVFGSVDAAAQQMVRVRQRYEPDADRAGQYNQRYESWCRVRDALHAAGRAPGT
jgi:xylulokinase